MRIGEKHPDPVVETSSLSSVEPPDIAYQVTISESIIDSGMLSALQLEAITYACQRHSTILPSGERAGYLIGMFTNLAILVGIYYERYILSAIFIKLFSLSSM